MFITGMFFAFWTTIAVALVVAAFFLTNSNPLLNGADILAAVLVLLSGAIILRMRAVSVAIALKERDDDHISRLDR